MADDLALRSPFYRVTVKALIFDASGRLLVTQTKDGQWEIPGGGWEHDEELADCLRRELQEELGVSASSIGDVAFTYRGQNWRGYMVVRLAVPATLSSTTFTPGDDMRQAKFVDQAEFLGLPMSSDEAPIKQCVDQIWSAVEKNASHL